MKFQNLKDCKQISKDDLQRRNNSAPPHVHNKYMLVGFIFKYKNYLSSCNTHLLKKHTIFIVFICIGENS
jgi:hypothetical protein